MSANYYPLSEGYAYIVSTRSSFLDVDMYCSLLAVAEGLHKKGFQARAYSTHPLGPSVVNEVISNRFARQYRSISNLQGTKKVLLLGDHRTEADEPTLDNLRAHYLFRKKMKESPTQERFKTQPAEQVTWSTLVWEWLCAQNVQHSLSHLTARGLVYGILHAHLGSIDETIASREAQAFRSICHLYNFSETHTIAPEFFSQIKDNFFKDVRHLWESCYLISNQGNDRPITVYPFECWDIFENEVSKMESYLHLKGCSPWVISCVSVKHQINLLVFSSPELAAMWSHHPLLKSVSPTRSFSYRLLNQLQIKKLLLDKQYFKTVSFPPAGTLRPVNTELSRLI